MKHSIVGVFLLVCILLCDKGFALAAYLPPGIVNYQGRFLDASGVPVTTTCTVTFTFWSAVVDGSLLGGYTDTKVVVPDTRGTVSTMIGSDPGNPVPADLFNSPEVWLNVEVNANNLVPRMRIAGVPYAFRANWAASAASAGSADAANYASSAGTANDAGNLGGVPPESYTTDVELAAALAGYTTHEQAAGSLAAKLDRAGTAYVIVQTTGSEVENGANLIAAYNQAGALSPHGSPLSATNRAVVFVLPGRYDLGSEQLKLDAEFVDIVGLSTNRASQQVFGTSSGVDTGVVVQTANDVHIENLTIECTLSTGPFHSSDSTAPAAYFPDSDTSSTIVRNCDLRSVDVRRALSMRLQIAYQGTYIDCVAGYGSFGTFGAASGTFINCAGGESAFGGGNAITVGGVASGSFTNCAAGDSGFAGWGTANGCFTSCTASNESFAGLGTASGVFTNCSSGDQSFGGYGTASGKFTGCTADSWSFGGEGTASGEFTNCKSGQDSFGGGSAGGLVRSATGRFVNCTGLFRCFGVSGGTPGDASGAYFYYCTGGANSFGTTGTPPPVALYCIKNGVAYP